MHTRHRVLLRCEALVPLPEQVNVCKITFGGKDDHELAIPEFHVQGDEDRLYDVQGVAGHTHALRITKQEFAKLRFGAKLDVLTERGLGHFHHVYTSYPA